MPWMPEVSEIRLAQVFWPFLRVEIIRVNTRHNFQHNLEEADTNFDTDHLIDSDSELTLIRYDDTIKTYINHANSSCYALLYRCNDNIKKMCSLNVLSNLIFSNSIKFRLNADQSRGGWEKWTQQHRRNPFQAAFHQIIQMDIIWVTKNNYMSLLIQCLTSSPVRCRLPST